MKQVVSNRQVWWLGWLARVGLILSAVFMGVQFRGMQTAIQENGCTAYCDRALRQCRGQLGQSSPPIQGFNASDAGGGESERSDFGFLAENGFKTEGEVNRYGIVRHDPGLGG